MQGREEILALGKERLQILEELLSDIENSREITVTDTFKVFAPMLTGTYVRKRREKMPNGEFIERDLEKEEAPFIAKQATVIKKILQHPKCPDNLSFEITLTNNNDGTYACGNHRTRTPLAPIFEALASGKCTARGLKIKLVG